MTHVRTLILGGGMSGLSCAYHLNLQQDNDYLLVERSDEPGGLSRSIKQDGFVFDHTGHLLHLHKPGSLELIQKLLGDNLGLNQRQAWIHSHNVDTRYPFQANLFGLPENVKEECLKGLEIAQIKGRRKSDHLDINGEASKSIPQTQITEHGREEPQTFRNWVEYTFGEGFGKHFFFPYNEKLWRVSPDELTAEWVAPFVPRPSMREITEGARTDQTKKFGYNATFYYPKEGGIQALAFAFARNLPNIRLNTSVSSIDLDRKEVTLSTGEIVTYEFLVNTAPLVRFLEMTSNLSQENISMLKSLKWSSVYNINLGIRRPNISEKHWIYFPETKPKYNFYRVGFPMNFSNRMTPPGCSSMYVEIGYRPDEPLDEALTMKETIKGLLECNLLKDEKEIITRKILRIPVAYVTYDKYRTRYTKKLLTFLEDNKVFSIGRFGGWKYSYMEEAILEGKDTAKKILGR